jgi:hypothetical protein
MSEMKCIECGTTENLQDCETFFVCVPCEKKELESYRDFMVEMQNEVPASEPIDGTTYGEHTANQIDYCDARLAALSAKGIKYERMGLLPKTSATD